MHSVCERILKWMDFKNLDVPTVSNSLGYSHPEKLYRLFRQDSNNKPSIDILLDLSNKFDNLNMHWLLTGFGQMEFDFKPRKDLEDAAYPPGWEELLERVALLEEKVK